MVSVGLGEILTIALIALIVFGPRRLPELARRVGRVVRDLRAVARELRAGIEAQGHDAEDDLGRVRRTMGATVTEESGEGEEPGGGEAPS